jgi:hypothetical protein
VERRPAGAAFPRDQGFDDEAPRKRARGGGGGPPPPHQAAQRGGGLRGPCKAFNQGQCSKPCPRGNQHICSYCGNGGHGQHDCWDKNGKPVKGNGKGGGKGSSSKDSGKDAPWKAKKDKKKKGKGAYPL